MSWPKVKMIGCLGDIGDHPSSSLLACALWIRDLIIKYNFEGNIFGTIIGDKVHFQEN
jgi:hypothetical protein